MATDTKLSDAEYQQALKNIRAFSEQMKRGQELADQGSLDVGRDIAAVFADGRWADDLPPVKRSHMRGRPVDPLGRSRFATWLRERAGYAPQYTYRLLTAARVADEFLRHGETIHEEGPLRPLSTLLAKGKADGIGPAWERAVRLAGGRTPSDTQVRAAIKELYPSVRPSRAGSQAAQKDWSDIIFTEFEQHFLRQHRLRDAGVLLLRMKDAYDKARAEGGS